MYYVCSTTAAFATGFFWFFYDAFMYGIGPAYWLTGVCIGFASGLAIGHGFRRVVLTESDRWALGFVVTLMWVGFLCRYVAGPVAILLSP